MEGTSRRPQPPARGRTPPAAGDPRPGAGAPGGGRAVSRRAWLGAALAAVGLLAVAGCGPPGVSTGPLAVPPALAPTPRPRLRVWALDLRAPRANELLQAQAREWSAARGADLDWFVLDGASFQERLSVAIQDGRAPDLAAFFDADLHFFHQQGRLHDLSDLVAELDAAEGGLLPAARLAVVGAGRAWGVPFWLDPWALVARRDLLARAGGADLPATWSDLVALCRRLAAADFFPLALNLGRCRAATYHLVPVLWAHGARLLDRDGRTVALQSGQTIQAVRFVADLVRGERLVSPGAVQWEDAGGLKAYRARQAALTFVAASALPDLFGADADLERRSALGAPPAAAEPSAPPIAAWSWGVLSAAGQPDLARDLLRHLFAPARYRALIEAADGRIGPTFQHALAAPFWQERPDRAARARLLPEGRPLSFPAGPSPAVAELTNTFVLPDMVLRVVVDGWSAEQAVAEAHQRAATIYQRPPAAWAARPGG